MDSLPHQPVRTELFEPELFESMKTIRQTATTEVNILVSHLGDEFLLSALSL